MRYNPYVIFTLCHKDENFQERVQGVFCGSEYPDAIQIIKPKSMPKRNDIIIAENNDTYVITHVDILAMPGFFICHYRKDAEILSAQNNFNIHGNISGNAIIGSQQNANITINPLSFDDVRKIIADTALARSEYEKIMQSVDTLQKSLAAGKISKGMLSSISDLLQKHGEIAGAIAGAITSFLLGR